jgi:Immunoglobulin I-set domain/Beta-propeller repeat
MIRITAAAANFSSASATPVNFKMKRNAIKILSATFICFTVVWAALTASAQTASILGNLPLYFEANQGQANVPAQFITRGCDSQFLISHAGAQMVFRKSATENAAVQMRFMGANPSAQICGDAELSGKINYLVGNNPAQWRSDIPTFAKVGVKGIYPGINVVYYGNQRQLEYDFTIAPGANPNAIAIHFDGADKISVSAQGELVLTLPGGEIRQPKPVIYQTIGGVRKAISGGYKILDAHTVAFLIGQYDRALPLVVDPILSYSTYFGGNAGDTAWAVAVSTNDGSIYVAGQTLSKQFYTNATSGAFQTNFAGGKQAGDAFVAKFDNAGQKLLYLTYLGGDSDDAAYGLAVDGAGDAYIAGATDSTNFPTTNAIYPKIGGVLDKNVGAFPIDAFVAELNSSGSDLVYSTYLGGSAYDAAFGVAVDSAGNAYVTGYTSSTNFPTTNAIQNHLACTNSFDANANAFVTEIASGGSNLVFSTYFGGTNFDQGQGIAVDNAGNIYVTGYTASTNFPTYNPLYSRLNGSTNKDNSGFDAFVAKFRPFSTNWILSASNQTYSISNLVYSTYLGGTNNDIGRSVACDTNGDAFVTGWTTSTNFPNTATNVPGLYSFVATNHTVAIATNAFLTEINPNGTALVYSALFGGKASDIGNGVAVDAAGDAFVVGSTTSTNFPTINTDGLLRATNSGAKFGSSDVFVIAFTNDATALIYSAYLGGRSDDYGYGIALDPMDNAYIVGQTLSTNFPTADPFQSSMNGTNDAFIAKIILTPGLPEIITQPTNQDLGAGSTATFNVTATGTTPLSFQWQFNGTNLMNGTNISGASSFGIATNSTLTINNAQTNNSGTYTVVVTNGTGMVTSSNAVLTVTNALPLITTQPVSQTNGVGGGSLGYVIFSISETNGTPPETYQWVKDGTNLVNGGTNFSTNAIEPFHIYGATNTTLAIVDPQTNDAGTYWLVITNPAGVVTSSNATLTVVSFPTIVTAPTNQTVGLGSTVTFVVKAAGTATLSFQWQFNGANLTDGTNADSSIISGSTSTALTINNTQTGDDGDYSVIVTNTLGSATNSPPAVLTVLTAPIFTGIVAGTNGSFILSGAGGTNSGIYNVLTSTNLATPLNLWDTLAAYHFGSQGQFTFTNTPPTNTPQLFYYLLQLPSP